MCVLYAIVQYVLILCLHKCLHTMKFQWKFDQFWYTIFCLLFMRLCVCIEIYNASVCLNRDLYMTSCICIMMTDFQLESLSHTQCVWIEPNPIPIRLRQPEEDHVYIFAIVLSVELNFPLSLSVFFKAIDRVFSQSNSISFHPSNCVWIRIVCFLCWCYRRFLHLAIGCL